MAEAARNYQSRLSVVPDNLDNPYNAAPLKTGGSDGTFDDMTERLAKLEGQFDGLKFVQTITMSVVGVVAVVLIAISTFLLTQNITIATRVNELPGKITADLRDLNQTMLQAVTASKQAPPQVILMPAPDRQPPPPEPSKVQ